MRLESDIKLDFDDILIKPKRTEATSRNISLLRDFSFKYSSRTISVCPLIAANMDTTGSIAMADAFKPFNALVALHKYYGIEQINSFYEDHRMANAFYSMGIKQEEYDRLRRFGDILGFVPSLICIDVANGYMQSFVDFIHKVREYCPDSIIMAGNVATPEMAQELVINGKADIIKVGIGPGSVCTTRLKTGVGYPQASAIAECADVAHGLKAHICADGGCKTPGDVAKAFGIGADFVMIGGMLAGTDECEGEWKFDTNIMKADWKVEQRTIDYPLISKSDEEYIKNVIENEGSIEYIREDKSNIKMEVEIKTPVYSKIGLKFHGMSSREAMELHGDGVADYKASEGKEIVVPYKGKAEEVIKDILGGIRGACTMVGAECIKDLPKCSTFIRVNRVKENLYE